LSIKASMRMATPRAALPHCHRKCFGKRNGHQVVAGRAGRQLAEAVATKQQKCKHKIRTIEQQRRSLKRPFTPIEATNHAT
jgi:hypothetical protein